ANPKVREVYLGRGK
ncbi:MAG TPA: hypothetical protein PLN52_02410, partial [Opitutaceae bacterium]|nr:hypothetical protein [Opitutaceae bacterium]